MLQNLPNEFKAKSSLYKTYNRFIHFLRENTKIRAKKNIEYHYDMRAGDRRNIRQVAPLGIPIFYKGYIKKRNVNNKKILITK